MGRKRFIFLTCWILVLSVLMGLLCISLFRLYEQAEKAQKIAFTGDVLRAGRDMADKLNQRINEEFLNDTAFISYNKKSHNGKDQHTLLIMDNGVPHALMTETVANYQGNVVILDKDTSYFHTDDSSKLVILDTIAVGHSTYTDSIILRMDSKELTQIIKNTLHEYGMDIYFEYGIYNLPQGTFTLRSKSMTQGIIDKAYVFALRTNNTEVYTHYLILNFPSERQFFLKRLGTIVLPIIGIIALLSLLFFIMIITLTQQKRNQEMKNDFINNMTHEFKTPISTISLACEAMSDESIQTDADTQKAYIGMIQAENERLQKMVTNILQLAQLKKGQLKINAEELNIHGLLNVIIRNFSLQVNNLGGKFITRFNAEMPIVIGDKSHIESIFINLIENALKYCNQKPVIDISTECHKDMIAVSIADNGIGIAKKNLKHIFDEFYRVTKGNVHDNKGYGLGLNYVKKIAELHDGHVKVKSEVGKGTTFTIYLPIKNNKK